MINTKNKNFRYEWSLLFLSLCAISIPFPYQLFNFQNTIVQKIFGGLCHWISESIFKVSNPIEMASDSSTLYALILVLFLISFVFIVFIRKSQVFRSFVLNVLPVFLSYFLALHLLKYGFDKITKGQFYLPEPNILYTPLGQISKDLLFWSTMGTSYAYNLFMGLLEIIPAILLLFRKTRLIGAIIAMAVLANIVAVNFSFNISVKVFSLCLLALSLIIISPYSKPLIQFFIKNQNTQIQLSKKIGSQNVFYRNTLKCFTISLILLEVFLPFFRGKHWNDDQAQRPFLHGAYELVEVSNNLQKISPDLFPIKRIFVHRHHYLIFQDQEDRFVDFKIQVDKQNQTLITTDYDLKQEVINYQYYPDSLLVFEYSIGDTMYILKARSLDWTNIPLLKNNFRLFIEE